MHRVMAAASSNSNSPPRTVPKMRPGPAQKVPALSTTPPQGPSRHHAGPAGLRMVALGQAAGAISAARWAERAARNSATDIGKLVEAYRSIHTVAWPLVMCYESATTVLSWEYPILTVCVWLCLQLCCVFMTSGQLLFVCFLTLSSLASIGYLSNVNQQLCNKSAPSSPSKGNKAVKQQSQSSKSVRPPSTKALQTVVAPGSPTMSSTSSSPALQSACVDGTKSHITKTTPTLRAASSSSRLSELGSEGQRSKSQSATVGPLSQSLPTTSPLSSISSSSTKSVSGSAAMDSSPSTSGTSRVVKKDSSEALVTTSMATAAQNHRASLEMMCQQRKELLGEYRQIIAGLGLWLSWAAVWFKWLEDMLLWKHKWRTVLFYLILFLGVVCIIYVPFRWVTMATSNCLFIGNPHSYSRVREYVKTLITSRGKEEDETSSHVTSGQQKAGEGTSASQLQKDGPVLSHPLADDMASSEEAEEDVSAPPQPPSQSPPPAEGPLAKGTTTGPQKRFDSGMCYLCGTLFTSLLKRRRYCRNCGRDFCPKCCFKKLPRSAFGATAPAAQTEKELICQLCFIKVTGEETGGGIR